MNHIRITAPVRGWEIGGGGAGRPVTREGGGQGEGDYQLVDNLLINMCGRCSVSHPKTAINFLGARWRAERLTEGG